MCSNNCIDVNRTLTLPSGTTSGAVLQQFMFINNGGIINYGNFELRDDGQLVCCQNIGTTKFGMKVVDGELRLVSPLTNRFMTINIPTNTNRKPNFEIQKDGNNYYLIGIDDIRQDYSAGEFYFKFKLNGNNNGVNIEFNSNELKIVIEGGHTLQVH